MWFQPPARVPDWRPAIRHLKKADAKMVPVIAAVGPCTLVPRRDYFVALCKAIYSQQLSTKVAATLFARFQESFPRRRPTPGRVLAFLRSGDAEGLRRCGLSRQKKLYLEDLAEHFASGRIQTRRLSRMSDEQIIEALTEVNGVGRWTAEMFLIFVLNRTDLLPVDDLGLREGVRVLYGLKERPGAAEVTRLAEPWRPYRSIATWYLWRYLSLAATKARAEKVAPARRREKF